MTDRAPMTPTQRFSTRVADYIRYRPSYPNELIAWLRDEFGLAPGQAVADVGSGTGISAALLLEVTGCVYAIEPNAAMRAAAEAALAGRPGFQSLAGSAEHTGLPDHSVDWVVAAQAFHWFEVDGFRAECLRILRPTGLAALIWNDRREDTPFLAEYEQLLREYGLDYLRVKHRQATTDGRLERFFGGTAPAGIRSCSFLNRQRVDFDGLLGRTLSASYMPQADHPRYPAMVAALRAIIERFGPRGHVDIDYETVAFVGRPGGG